MGETADRTIACGGNAVDITLTANTYNVSEDPSDTSSITVNLDNCGTAGSVTVVTGETTNCLLVNTLTPPVTGGIIVDKVCDPANIAASFTVTLYDENGKIAERQH